MEVLEGITNVQKELNVEDISSTNQEQDAVMAEVTEIAGQMKRGKGWSKKGGKKDHGVGVPQLLVETWKGIQNTIKDKIIINNTEMWQDNFTLLKHVAGLDIQSTVYNGETIAVPTIVICSYPSLKVVLEKTAIVNLNVPYVPGFLAFKDADPLIELTKRIIEENPEFTPDLILTEGNGVLHPRRCGAACHIGHELSIPTIGVAKNYFHINGANFNKKKEETLKQAGDSFTIVGKDKKVLGMAVKSSSSSKKPIFISVGNKISLETAKNVLLSLSKFRIPEPLRYADMLSRSTLKTATNGAKFVDTGKGVIQKGNLVFTDNTIEDL